MLGDEKAGGATLRPYGQRISPLDGDRISKKEKTYLSMVFSLNGWEQRISPLDGDRTSKKLMLGFVYSHPNLRKRPSRWMVFFLMAGSKGYHPSMGIEPLRN
jgi:hypothetical protein